VEVTSKASKREREKQQKPVQSLAVKRFVDRAGCRYSSNSLDLVMMMMMMVIVEKCLLF